MACSRSSPTAIPPTPTSIAARPLDFPTDAARPLSKPPIFAPPCTGGNTTWRLTSTCPAPTRPSLGTTIWTAKSAGSPWSPTRSLAASRRLSIASDHAEVKPIPQHPPSLKGQQPRFVQLSRDRQLVGDLLFDRQARLLRRIQGDGQVRLNIPVETPVGHHIRPPAPSLVRQLDQPLERARTQ